ncbi:E-beta-farnesene synthase 1 [Tanacetum coccineum]
MHMHEPVPLAFIYLLHFISFSISNLQDFEKMSTIPVSSVSFSSSASPLVLDDKLISTKQDVIRHTMNLNASIWGDQFLTYDELKEEVKKELMTIKGSNEPMQHIKLIGLIDAVQRLGIAYHFEEEIEEAISNKLQGDDDIVLVRLLLIMLTPDNRREQRVACTQKNGTSEVETSPSSELSDRWHVSDLVFGVKVVSMFQVLTSVPFVHPMSVVSVLAPMDTMLYLLLGIVLCLLRRLAAPYLLRRLVVPYLLKRPAAPYLLRRLAGPYLLRRLVVPYLLRTLAAPYLMRRMVAPYLLRRLDGPYLLRRLTAPYLLRRLAGPYLPRRLVAPYLLKRLAGPYLLRRLAAPCLLRRLTTPYLLRIHYSLVIFSGHEVVFVTPAIPVNRSNMEWFCLNIRS